jgi:hypothetical protein
MLAASIAMANVASRARPRSLKSIILYAPYGLHLQATKGSGGFEGERPILAHGKWQQIPGGQCRI